jgi:putative ABC transport system permease protein
MKGAFYLHYALRSLQRGGQRTGLAMLCVAFGVMSLVSMQILATTISNTMLLNPHMMVGGGDAQVDRPGQFLTADDIAELERLQEMGHIEAYTLFASQVGQLLKREDSGRVYFVGRAMGVDATSYPLVGEIMLSGPDGITLFAALESPGDAAITRDLAKRLDLKIGDTFILSDSSGSVPTRLHVTAIIQSTPDRRGDTVRYNQETASMLAGRPDALTSALLRLGSSGDALPLLRDSGWNVRTAERAMLSEEIREVFDFMLKGAGILGLLVGGIGVANTMQVLLARRTLEIATLKTLGYRQRDLVALLGLETALLGLAGSVLGSGAAIVFSKPLIGSSERISSMLLEWSVNPLTLVGGMLVGTVTAVIFGVYAILRASAVRPAVLLRNLPVSRPGRKRLQALGVYLVLALPFGLLSSLIMGSPLWGVAVVGLALVGLVTLGLLLGAALFLLLRLPMPRIRFLALARNNLKRQGLRTIFALIALFVGVFAIGFATATILSAQAEFDSRSGSNEGYNLFILTTHAQSEQVAGQLDRQPIQEVHARYQVPLQRSHVRTAQVRLSGGEAYQAVTIHELEGRADSDVTWDLDLSGEPWGTAPDGAYLPAKAIPENANGALGPGSTVTIVTAQGAQRDLRLAGIYSPKEIDLLSDSAQGILVSRELALELGGAETAVTFIAEVPANRLESTTEALGRALPETIVVSMADLNDFFQRILKNLFIFAVTVAGLALVAGAVLIANAVGLAMVERRREVGILKAVGFGSGDVLRTLLLEHGMLGLLAGVAGTTGVALAVTVLNALEPRAGLSFQLLPALGITLAAIAIALMSTALVAWQPTRVRPLTVLRDE